VRSFFDTFPVRPRFERGNYNRLAYYVTVCPEEGKLGRDFKPVPVEPWRPEPLVQRPRSARRRLIEAERVEALNATLNWDVPEYVPYIPKEPDEPQELDGVLNFEREEGEFEEYEFEDPRYFEAAEAHGVRSLMQPKIAGADYSWRAPAARCRSCGCETWVASIADGIRMLRNPRHRQGCAMPPNRLEVEQSCGE